MAEPPAARIAAAAHDLIGAGRLELAGQAVELALAIDATAPAAHVLRAHLLELQGDFETALGHWRQAVAMAPTVAGHRFNLAISLICHGDLAEGLALAEARLEKPDWAGIVTGSSMTAVRQRMPTPLDDLSGKRVLVFTEQGLGDSLWAARWLSAFGARCARMDLACRPELSGLLANQIQGALVGPPAGKPDAKLNLSAIAAGYDAFVPIMSLPHLLGVTTPAPAVPWIQPDADAIRHWRTRYRAALPGVARIIGVVAQANPDSASATARSLPPAMRGMLAGRAGTGIVILQGGARADREALKRALPGAFDPMAEGVPDLANCAAMIAATDLVITADTMAAHLAGAIGHPSWVAIPTISSLYWGRTGDISPWYANQRLFRQSAPGDWHDVGEAVIRALGRNDATRA